MINGPDVSTLISKQHLRLWGKGLWCRWHEGNIHVVMKSWRLCFRRVGDEVGREGQGKKGLGTYVANRAMPHSAAGRLHRGCRRRRVWVEED